MKNKVVKLKNSSLIFIFVIYFYPINIFAAFTCTITTVNIVFSAYNPYDATFETTAGNVTVRCTNGTGAANPNYTVTFSAGGSGNRTARLVKNGVDSVSYNLYKDSGYTQILGNGTSSTVTITNSYNLTNGASRTDNYTVYGKIPVQPLSKPKTYTDSITATLTY